MKNFDAALLRLKGQIDTTEDQAVASLLGLSKASFSDRKRRDAFPVDKLRALAQQRPELGIDVEYVLTGQSTLAAGTKLAQTMSARVRELRGTRSVDEFAALLGTTPQTIEAIETKAQLPSNELMKRLIDTHPERDLLWMMGGESPTLDQVGGALNPLEVILIGNYRTASKEGRAALRRMAAFFATYQGED